MPDYSRGHCIGLERFNEKRCCHCPYTKEPRIAHAANKRWSFSQCDFVCKAKKKACDGGRWSMSQCQCVSIPTTTTAAPTTQSFEDQIDAFVAGTEAELQRYEQEIARIIEESIAAVNQALTYPGITQENRDEAAAAIDDFRTYSNTGTMAARRKRQATELTAFCDRLQQKAADLRALAIKIQEGIDRLTSDIAKGQAEALQYTAMAASTTVPAEKELYTTMANSYMSLADAQTSELSVRQATLAKTNALLKNVQARQQALGCVSTTTSTTTTMTTSELIITKITFNN
jgi:hypothetical protein